MEYNQANQCTKLSRGNKQPAFDHAPLRTCPRHPASIHAPAHTLRDLANETNVILNKVKI